MQLPPLCPTLGTWPTTQACAPTGNQIHDPLVCRPAINPLSHTSQGPFSYLFFLSLSLPFLSHSFPLSLFPFLPLPHLVVHSNHLSICPKILWIIQLSISPVTFLSRNLSSLPSFFPPISSFFPPIHLLVDCLSIYHLSIHPSIHPPIHPPSPISVHPTLRPPLNKRALPWL